MRIFEQCTCSARIEVKGSRRQALAQMSAFRTRHSGCEPEQPDDSGATGTQAELAPAHRGPSIGFTLPDADPDWIDRAKECA